MLALIIERARLARAAQWARDWALMLAMAAGVAGYFIYASIHQLDVTHHAAWTMVKFLQPALIFAMLLLTFCRVDPSHLHLRPWHGVLLAVQAGGFTLLGVSLLWLRGKAPDVLIEGAMLCLICPTATAATVITRRLGGNMEGVVTYTILINLVTALLVPVLLPLVLPNPGLSVTHGMLLILGQVFPLLLLPLVVAFLMAKLTPRLHHWCATNVDASFWLWTLSLSLAIAVTTDSVVHSTVDWIVQGALAGVAGVCCLLQFALGRRVGASTGDSIAGGQSLGQKNTVLAIWMGYTFFTPVTSVVGGFYSLCHNLVNTWQLRREARKSLEITIDLEGERVTGS